MRPICQLIFFEFVIVNLEGHGAVDESMQEK